MKKRSNRAFIQQQKAMKRLYRKGCTLKAIGEEHGCTATWVYRVMNCPNPGGALLFYRCYVCSEAWPSTGRYFPARCPSCSSVRWREGGKTRSAA